MQADDPWNKVYCVYLDNAYELDHSMKKCLKVNSGDILYFSCCQEFPFSMADQTSSADEGHKIWL